MNKPALPALLLALAIPTLAAAQPMGVSEALRPAADERLDFMANAQGVQIYKCKPKAGDPYAYEWAFVAPEASLTEGGKAIGKHYAGPTWEANDGSKVKGATKQRQDASAGNIPWLLLAGTSEGAGRLAGVTNVQRVATQGGVAPNYGCDQMSVDKEVRVPYTAEYYFYRKK
jgi:hypothetical protein